MPLDREVRLGTRGSHLALWQANAVAARLAASGGPACRIVVIRTSGDRLQDASLSEAGGKRLFVKEIEDALQRGEIDLAVHSSKDLPVELAEGLMVGGVLPREDPRDAVILPAGSGFEARDPALQSLEALTAILGARPIVGTSSVRRVAQLSRLWPTARFTAIRGNLDTRLRKLDDGQYGALVLAAAGLRRLGVSERISLALPASTCVPAPGQGIVAVEVRADDEAIAGLVGGITDRAAHAALATERALVSSLGGGCQTPIGALASLIEGDAIELVAVVAAPDGSRMIRASGRAATAEGDLLGARVAHELIALGADKILAECRAAAGD